MGRTVGLHGEGHDAPAPTPLRLELKQLWDRNVAEREAKKKAQHVSAAGMQATGPTLPVARHPKQAQI
jgi:hypothetical protein